MKTMNIGIVAHVDAGKTSLTERLLYVTNVIDEVGRVDKGNTQTDSMELERRRGITIKASVVSFFVNGLKINLIDTPGHADFIAEVERSFSVLDGAVLVISAVEGIQAQTKILMSVLRKLQIPTILFVNKIDRSGAQSDGITKSIREKLAANVIPLYKAENIGTKQAFIVEHRFNNETDPDFMEQCIELAAWNDEALLESCVNGEQVTEEQVKRVLMRQIREAKLYPIFFGSAMTGIGVSELLAGVEELFPVNEAGDGEPLSGVVFKMEKEHSGERIAYVRVFSGSMSVREYVNVSRKNKDGVLETHADKIKKLHLFNEGKSIPSQIVEAGDFCKVWGWKNIKIGDVVGERSDKIKDIHFAAPQMETRIEARQKEQEQRLYQALTDLSEEDPLIEVWKDDFHHELYVRLFGEVQKEVIETTLKEKYRLDVSFSETRIVCIEKPKGTGQAAEVMGAADNPFYATVGFIVEPGVAGSGVTYKLGVELGSLPLAFHKAIEDSVYAALAQGLYGWEVTDIAVTLTHTGYCSPVTVAGDFRKLTPLVLMEALFQAGTDVYEPINEFELSVPDHALSRAMHKLSGLKAIFKEPVQRKDSWLLTGTIPVAATEDFKRSLHSFTEGEGMFMANPCGFEKIEGEYPTRKRADYNPLNRKDYMLHILRAY
ncbi:tetracycline resistance ribosomal protection protein [Paenibacillus apiarius]|uniref:Tetracycline resistance ribosomal protection protein n=1 Tax=Paenibacillus apiarius TaxID=46240 RepID=A0ABT4E1M9_9BACL|nr:tetracycline resistance ribosomal protection protein [Paenibacillus apiarius]MCY9516933.1 tetracycline resistance ribosomal protection protein [Paenibacillus apiarius]MCY9523519.1 tetracycline resistance ribosomal protection protein [Paenibacillus apiarius]MCY9554836.1 tetracycline resistance ribosomal protection protein [Paenibacillus apiarius]MCY9561305.1 tetracycline resistance ribosomal protection protein [Paenibacillus apiarius]MCY9686978.1 tetracycline resistance ribosomal protection 